MGRPNKPSGFSDKLIENYGSADYFMGFESDNDGSLNHKYPLEKVADYTLKHREMTIGNETKTVGGFITSANNRVKQTENTVAALSSSVSSQSTQLVNLNSKVRSNEGNIGELQIDLANNVAALTQMNNKINAIESGPLVAETASQMTNTSKVYVYVGNEENYTNGDWYYYNGRAWVSGGAYNAQGLNLDTTLTVEGLAPDSKAVGDAINAASEEISEEISDLNGALDYTQYGDICSIGDLEENGTVVVVPHFINNAVKTATGEIGSANAKRCTNKELIYIPDGATIQTTVTSDIYSPGLFCFDRNKSFLGQASSNGQLVANTRYIRLLVLRIDNGDITPEQANSYLTLTISKTTTKSVVDNLIENLPEIIKDDISEPRTNKYNPNTKVTGFIRGNTGEINPSTDYFTSDFIDVSGFTEGYAFTPKARKILFYDANKTAIDASFYSDETAAGVLSLNSAYKYVRFSWYKTSTDVLVADAETLPPYEPYEIVAKNGVNFLNYDTKTRVQQMIGEGGKSSQIASYLNGKTVAIFGDSIMYGAGAEGSGVGDILAEKYGMTLEKYCVSGSTMGVRTDDPSYTVDEVHHIAKQVRNAIAANIDPDLIILNGGTNDIGGGITIGEMSEVYTQPLAENYFANGFETVAYLLMKNFVGVPIIYMRAHNMSSRSYEGQIDYGELGIKIAEKWGIRTVDMYKRMNTQLAEYRTAYLADYTHPNAAGYNKYYIPAIEDFVFDELVN